MTKRVAILISGSGSNMEALIRSMVGDHPARPVLVISNKPEAGGLAKAQTLGVETCTIDHRPFVKDREAFDEEVQKALIAAKADIVCHAGFMRILTPGFANAWSDRMLNIHPSLLPRHKGLHTHAKVLEAGDTEHGCSVHRVTAELDGGPVLGQARLRVQTDDTIETLTQKVQALEHRLYPEVLRRFAAGDLRRIDLT